MSQAQNENTQTTKRSNRKRTLNSSSTSEEASESEIEETYHGKQKRRNNNMYENQNYPTIVIISCPDVKLAHVSPIKIAKELKSIGYDCIKNVTKTNQGGICVRCYTTGQAQKLKGISQLGQWVVTTEYAKSETQSKGVVSGVPRDIMEEEIVSECKQSGVIDARRFMFKRDGIAGKSLSVCLTFNTPNLNLGMNSLQSNHTSHQ